VRSARFNRTAGRPSALPVCVTQPKTLAARCLLAHNFAADFGISMPVLVDDPTTDAFDNAYSPWPLRLYLVRRDGTLGWIAEPEGCSFEGVLGQLREQLLSL